MPDPCNARPLTTIYLGDPVMRKGFTIIELLVVVSIIGLLIAILLPAIGKARDGALLTQSQSNIRAIVQGATTYGADFQDRQWTAIAENIGGDPNNGDCSKYAAKRCSAQLVLGFDKDGASVGFFIPIAADCGGKIASATCDVAKAYWPCDFDLAKTGNFGSWRLPNAKSFSNYVGGKFYGRVYYAPKDKITLQKADPFIETGDDFAGTIDKAVLSSYCWSPAAMWSPDVLSKKNGYQDPKLSPGGFRSPASSQASFPELKTRLIEHQWLQNKPSMDFMDGGIWGSPKGPNPDSFSPKIRSVQGQRISMPWFFNEGGQSSPVTAFFDGHVGQLGVSEAVDTNKRITFADSSNSQIAVKGSFFGAGGGGNKFAASFPMATGYTFGFFDSVAYNDGIGCSYHVLTADGIRGRDTIGQK